VSTAEFDGGGDSGTFFWTFLSSIRKFSWPLQAIDDLQHRLIADGSAMLLPVRTKEHAQRVEGSRGWACEVHFPATQKTGVLPLIVEYAFLMRAGLMRTGEWRVS
jgi:hypothetical protein